MWTAELFQKHWKPAQVKAVIRKIWGHELPADLKLETHKAYPLNRELFGVSIEYGTIELVKVTVEEALKLLNSFTAAETDKKGALKMSVTGSLDAVTDVAKRYHLPSPHAPSVEGYILNGELVETRHDGFDRIQLKYKDKPENIFYLYFFYFFVLKNELFLVIEKNI